MKNLFDIQGQVVVITGGTGVLGREIRGIPCPSRCQGGTDGAQ